MKEINEENYKIATIRIEQQKTNKRVFQEIVNWKNEFFSSLFF